MQNNFFEKVGRILEQARSNAKTAVNLSMVCLLYTSRLLPYLMIREGTEWICNRHHIDRRGFQPVVVDSGDSDTEYVLAQIGQDLNFLTILTSRPEFFEEYVEQLYAQTGLMASVLTKPLYGQIQGNVVLDLNKAADRDYRYYPQNAIVLELTGMEKKRRDIICLLYTSRCV